VILVHGDPEHSLLVEQLMRRVTTHCCGEAGIGYGDWASIGVGQEYLSQGVPAIRSALEHKKRVLVVGLYVSSSAAKIHQRSAGMKRQQATAASLLEGKDVVFSDEAIVAHPELLRWVLKAAEAAVAADRATASQAAVSPTRE